MAEINWGILNPSTPSDVGNAFYKGQQEIMQNQLAQSQLRQSQGANALQQYQLSSAQRNDVLQNKMLAELQSANGDPEAIKNALIRAGKPQEAFKLQTDQAALQKTQAETHKFNLEFVNQAARDMAQNPSDENIMRWGELSKQKGVHSPEDAQRLVQDALSKDIATRRQMFAGMGAKAEDLISRFYPKVGEGMQLNPDGSVSNAPGYVGAASNLAGNKKAAEANAEASVQNRNTIVTPELPGGPVAMTKQQWLAQMGGQGASAPSLQQGQPPPQQVVPGMEILGQPPLVDRKTGVPLQTKAQQEFSTEQAKNAAKYSGGLNDRVQSGTDLMARLDESRQALQQFRAGGGAESRAKVAQMAQAFGAPDSLVSKIAGGNIASMQEFQKLAVQQAMETLKQSMATDSGQAGRMTQSEFQQFLKVNPNLDTDPRAIEKLYSFSEKIHQRNLAEQKEFTDFTSNGGDPTKWQSHWAQTLNSQRQAAKSNDFSHLWK